MNPTSFTISYPQRPSFQDIRKGEGWWSESCRPVHGGFAQGEKRKRSFRGVSQGVSWGLESFCGALSVSWGWSSSPSSCGKGERSFSMWAFPMHVGQRRWVGKERWWSHMPTESILLERWGTGNGGIHGIVRWEATGPEFLWGARPGRMMLAVPGGTAPGWSVCRTASFHCKGTWAQSWWGLRSCKLHSMVKKKKVEASHWFCPYSSPGKGIK